MHRAGRSSCARAGRLAHDDGLPRKPRARRDGRLIEVEAVWIAEAERFDGMMVVASATGPNVEEAWATLRDDIEGLRYQTLSRIRLMER